MEFPIKPSHETFLEKKHCIFSNGIAYEHYLYEIPLDIVQQNLFGHLIFLYKTTSQTQNSSAVDEIPEPTAARP